MAVPSGLPDTLAAQELGAWTMDLPWTKVINRIEQVRAYTQNDNNKTKGLLKVNVKGYRVVPQAMFMQLYKPLGVGKNEEIILNYFETGTTFAIFQRNLFAVKRLLVALIAKLPKLEEEPFWQWCPGYGCEPKASVWGSMTG
eukprot:1235750-Amphidinium_carterae.1